MRVLRQVSKPLMRLGCAVLVAAVSTCVLISGIERPLLASDAMSAQPGAPAYKLPKTPFGQPDLQGIWQVWNTARYSVEPHNASPGLPAGFGFIVDPPDGLIPYTPWARNHQKENLANSRTPDPIKNADPVAKCYIPGAPRLMYLGWPFQIIQTPTEIHFLSEYAHVWRVATFQNVPRPKEVDNFMGVVRARWSGETLILDTTNLNDVSWLDQSGNFLSKTSHVVESLTRVGPDLINYEVTIEDPRIFTKPWKMRMAMQRQPQNRLLEYECIDLLEQSGHPPTWDRDWDKPLAIPKS